MRGGQVRVFGGGDAFIYLFLLQEGGDGYRAGVRDGWLRLPFWMMCAELCLVQLSTLCWKRPIFQPERKSSTPIPEKTPSIPPSAAETPCSFLPASPWLRTKRFMWLDSGAGWERPPPLSSEDTCFPEGWGCVGAGRAEQRVEGVQLREHFHTAFLWNTSLHLYKVCLSNFYFYNKKPFMAKTKSF